MRFYRDHYDAIIIGGALAGLASALTLGKKGKSVLVLEQHNLPGGLATSFVRGKFEFEATMHEMMSIGPEERPLKIRQFFNDYGVNIDWMRVPEAYRIVLPNSGLDVTLPAGFEEMADAIDKAVPGEKDKVLKLMDLCNTVYNSVNVLSETPMSKLKMLKEHEAFVKTAGYSAKEVLDTFGFNEKTIELLSPYWIYVGSPLDKLPFTIYAVLMADYFGGGSYICRHTSHEMSMAMATRAEELGAQIEYRQRVDKILVENGRVTGVRTARGDVIHSDYVISGSYPNKVYASMIEPASAVPSKAIRWVNGHRIGVTAFSVLMMLEGTPEELGITSYSTFSGSTMDTEKIWKSQYRLAPYDYITTICVSLTNPDAVPKGYTELSITALPPAKPWFSVTADTYFETKRRIAEGMIHEYEKVIGHRLMDKIAEIEIESPMTVAHYTGAWNGGIYGYQHHQQDNIVARLVQHDKEEFIGGLFFAGAHAISGNGMGPAITNGRKAAKDVLDEMEEREAKNA